MGMGCSQSGYNRGLFLGHTSGFLLPEAVSGVWIRSQKVRSPGASRSFYTISFYGTLRTWRPSLCNFIIAQGASAAMSLDKNVLLFKVVTPDNHEFVIYTNGLTEGFPPGSYAYNRYPSLRKSLIDASILPTTISTAVENGREHFDPE